MNPSLSNLWASGDNSNGNLWNCKFKLSPRFVRCDSFPFDSTEISYISAWNESIAFFSDESKVYFKEEDQELKEYDVNSAIQSIRTLEDCVIALLDDGSLIEIPSMKKLKAESCNSFCCSMNYVCYINKDNEAKVIRGDRFSEPEKLASNVSAIGCTNDTIFIFDSETKKLTKIEDGNTMQLQAPSKIIAAIYCSEDDALFIDTEGNLYKYNYFSISQVFGLPQIVFASLGPQHYAAISSDGRLFTWGFNPSGQLGIGNDRPTSEPSYAINHAIIVACGTHWTIVVRSQNDLPKIPELFDKSKIKVVSSQLPQSQRRITRAELLS